MKANCFVAHPAQEGHLRFVQSVFGARWIRSMIHPRGITGLDVKEIGPGVLEHDSQDAVWFFCETYPELSRRLRGKQVLVPHGASFKNFLGGGRARCLSEHFDVVLASCVAEESQLLRAGVPREKVRAWGLPLFLDIPDKAPDPGAVFFGSTWFKNWNHQGVLTAILKRLPAGRRGYVSLHPHMPIEWLQRFERIVAAEPRLSMVKSHDQLLEALACSSVGVVGGPSTVATAFWYMRKPLVMLRGRITRHPLKLWRQWQMISKEIDNRLFDEILAESEAISMPWQFSEKLLRKARSSRNAERFFFPQARDRAKMEAELRLAIEGLF